MPSYIYKARDETGRLVRGTLEALSQEDLADKLRGKGCVPTYIQQAASRTGIQIENIGGFTRIRHEDMIMFNLQLANMLDSGLTILSSLGTISRQVENRKLKEIIEDLGRSIEAGSTFCDALAKYPKVFSALFVNTVKAGEASGHLDTVLNRLAIFLEQQADLRQKIQGALFYPAILLVAGVGVIILVVTFVMPKFVEIFTKADIVLPLPTIILYQTGIALKKFWYIFLLSTAALILGVRWLVNTERGRWQFDRLQLALPVIGPLVRKVVISRFSRTLATLLDSGVPLLQSLEIVADVSGNKVVGAVVRNVRNSVEEGERLAHPLKISEEFPSDAVQMIAIGEETGQLGKMLNKVADFYDTAVGYAIKKLTALIEPVFLVIMGSLIGFMMASLLLPIFDMVKTIQR
jgi:type IV pilus assembly protein PilC